MVKRVPSWGALAFASLLFAAHAWIHRAFAVDDAFISFRVVQQWTHGNGLVYNVGEHVEAYSNFLWIVLLAPFDLLGMDLLRAARVLGFLFSLGSLVVVHRCARRFSGSDLASPLLAACGPFAAWSMGGLETPLFAFLVLSACATFAVEESDDRGSRSGALFALVALTRPEGLLFALTAFAYRMLRLRRDRAQPEVRDAHRVALMASWVLPHLVWRATYYGHLIPNSVHAKTIGMHPQAVFRGLVYVCRSFSATGGFFFIALTCALALLRARRSPFVAYFAVTIALYFGGLIVEGADWMPMQRVLVHVLPLLLLLVNDGLCALAELELPRAAVLVPLLAAGQAAYLVSQSVEQRALAAARPDAPIGGAFEHMRRNVCAGDTIAVVFAGLPAFQAPLTTRVIDMVGLADGHIGYMPVRGDRWSKDFVFGRWDVDYVLAQRPRFVQVTPAGTGAGGETLTEFVGSTLLVNDPRFLAAYEPVREEGVSGLYARRGTGGACAGPHD